MTEIQSNLFSEEVLDIDTLMEKTNSEVKKYDLFDKILNENDSLSPFLKKKIPNIEQIAAFKNQ